tara:strand:+ start:69 stop:254 length:186 start_codon:yes stop_codon:yes gene_type:complete
MVKKDEDYVEGVFVGKEFKLRSIKGDNTISPDNNDEFLTPNVNFIEKVKTTDADASVEYGE